MYVKNEYWLHLKKCSFEIRPFAPKHYHTCLPCQREVDWRQGTNCCFIAFACSISAFLYYKLFCRQDGGIVTPTLACINPSKTALSLEKHYSLNCVCFRHSFYFYKKALDISPKSDYNISQSDFGLKHLPTRRISLDNKNNRKNSDGDDSDVIDI